MSLSSSSSLQNLRTLFWEGHALTQAEISDRLDISTRHVRRLIRKLREAGEPVEERWRGREKEYRLPPEAWEAGMELEVTEREALALLLAAGAAESGLGSPPLRTALTGAVETLVEELTTSVTTFEPDALMAHLHFGEAASVDVDPDVFIALVEALGNRQAVAMDYYSASSDRRYEGRTIEPWGLAVRGDTWLCVAYDYRREERRDFSLARI
jgi:predicted DNA-binding transcriptional regulator YafY